MMVKEYWDGLYASRKDNDPKWIDAYTPFLRSQSKVLDVGCGSGELGEYLNTLGHFISGVDLSEKAVELAREINPSGLWIVQDIQEPLPFEEESFDVIVASLSLHYFPWEKVAEITKGLRTLLKPDGLFLFRMNSISDDSSNQPSEVSRYFFSEEDIRKSLHTWNLLLLEEKLVTYYGKSKVLWEGIAKPKEGTE